MATSSEQVNESLTSVAAISQEASASDEQVAAKAEELTAQIEEVSAIAQSLAQQADDLRQAVERFRLEDETDRTPSRARARQSTMPAAKARQPVAVAAGGNRRGYN